MLPTNLRRLHESRCGSPVDGLFLRTWGTSVRRVGIACAALACSAHPEGDRRIPDVTATPSGAPVFLSGPTLTENPVAEAPLSWRLEAKIDRPTTISVAVSDAFDAWARGPWAVDGTLDVWLQRWHPGETHTVVVTATDNRGLATSATLEVTAPPLPADFPDIRFVSADPVRMAPGYTVFSPSHTGPEAPQYLTAYDENGLPVWWYAAKDTVYSIERTADGVRYLWGRDALYEVDLQGNRIGEWTTRTPTEGGLAVDLPAMHHDVLTLPDGHLLALTIEGRNLPLFPLSEAEPSVQGPAFVAGDVIAEIDPDTGAILHEWPLLDLLDETRIGYDALASVYWEALFGEPTEDWSHGNALAYDPGKDRIWVSLRHQDAVVGFGRTSGALEAIVGSGANWRAPWASALFALDGGTWMYHQHGINLGPNGTLFAFDNGNNGASPPSPRVPTVVSRAVEYALDESTRTVEERWSYADPRGFFAGEMGNVQYLPAAETVLVNFGAIKRKLPEDPTVVILEVTHEAPPRVVFEINVYPPSIEQDKTVFRAHRWEEF